MNCFIKWVDLDPCGCSESIALTVCYDPMFFGEEGSEPLPICRQHAMKKTKWWKLLPLPGQTLEESDPLVREDARYFNTVGSAVILGIKSHRIAQNIRDAVEIFNKLVRYSNYWGFEHQGIFYGVEDDGYIHT